MNATNTKELTYRIREARDQTKKQAIILLHGFGANMDDLAPLADWLDPEGAWTFIFPNAPIEVPIGPHMVGYAWFPLDMREVEAAMMAGTYRDYSHQAPSHFIHALQTTLEPLKKLVSSYDRLIVGGFSQGGMLASHLVLSGELKAEKLILLSTTLIDKKKLTEHLTQSLTRPQVFLSHGSHDPVLSPNIATEFVLFLREHDLQVTSVFFSGGHEIPMNVLEKLRQFILLS